MERAFFLWNAAFVLPILNLISHVISCISFCRATRLLTSFHILPLFLIYHNLNSGWLFWDSCCFSHLHMGFFLYIATQFNNYNTVSRRSIILWGLPYTGNQTHNLKLTNSKRFQVCIACSQHRRLFPPKWTNHCFHKEYSMCWNYLQ